MGEEQVPGGDQRQHHQETVPAVRRQPESGFSGGSSGGPSSRAVAVLGRLAAVVVWAASGE